MTRGNILLTILLASIAAVTWFVLARREDAQKPTTPTIESADLGYYLLDAKLVGLDPDGHELYVVHAERIEQRPADDSVSLQRMTVNYATGSDTPWTAVADTGYIPASGDVIELQGNVQLSRTGPPDAERLEIDTPQLELAVRDRIARTAEAINLTQGTDTLSATGMEADLRKETLRLDSRVHARFPSGTS
jgi:LPS export ABC transporter protein LptC